MVQLAVEDSNAAWRVLIEVLRGNSTMTGVKRSLKITHPSVLEQLQKLEKAGYIKGEKQGKQKFYTPNWPAFKTFLLSAVVGPKADAKVQGILDTIRIENYMDKLIGKYFSLAILGGVLNFVVDLSVDGRQMSIEDLAKTSDDPYDYERIVEEARKNTLSSDLAELYAKNEQSASTVREALERFFERMVEFSNTIIIDIDGRRVKADDFEPEFLDLCRKLDEISRNLSARGIYRDVFFEKLVELHIRKESKEVVQRIRKFFGG